MNLLEKFKIIIKRKPQSIENTGLSKIDTSLIYIPKLKELSESDKEKVLEYIKEIDISNLESIINYASDLNEKANSNTEILMRLYYRLVDETEIKLDADNIIYDKYNALININELNLCKAELLNLREEGILKVIALEEVLKKESSRKLFFSSIFGKYEKLKRKAELNSLMDAIERTKVVIKVIEQLIQTVNINVSSELLKVTSENVLLNIVKEENSDSVIKEIIDETKSMLKTFLPEYEEKFVFDTKNINECIVNLSIAKRLLDLYAYNHKEEAEKVLYEDIRNFRETEFLATEKENTKEKIEYIENSIKLFKYYIKDKDVFRTNVQNFYECKFIFLIRNILNLNESPFKNIKNKFELECYYELVSQMTELLIKGDNVLITLSYYRFLPKFSKEKQKELQTIILKLLRKSDLSNENILCDLNLLKFIISLSNRFDYKYYSPIINNEIAFSYDERYLLMKDYKKDDIKFKNNEQNITNLHILKFLFKIFACYEAYNNCKEMPYNFFEKLYIANDEIVHINKNEYLPFYLDILEQSDFGIILPGIKEIMTINCENHNLCNSSIKKLVMGSNLEEIDIFHYPKPFPKLESLDLSLSNEYNYNCRAFFESLCSNHDISELIINEKILDSKDWIDSILALIYGGYCKGETVIVKGESAWCIDLREMNRVHMSKYRYARLPISQIIKLYINEKNKYPDMYNEFIMTFEKYNDLKRREYFQGIEFTWNKYRACLEYEKKTK